MKTSVCVSMTYHKTLIIDVHDSNDEDELRSSTFNKLKDTINGLEEDGWCEDEIEIIRDE